MSQANNSIGNAYAGQDNYTRAEEYYNLALKYAKDAKDDMMIAISSYGVANILNEKKKYPESIKAFDNAAILFKKLNMNFEYAAVRVTHGSKKIIGGSHSYYGKNGR
jgi:tetratricopeptide (TPR) repeat protein